MRCLPPEPRFMAPTQQYKIEDGVIVDNEPDPYSREYNATFNRPTPRWDDNKTEEARWAAKASPVRIIRAANFERKAQHD